MKTSHALEQAELFVTDAVTILEEAGCDLDGNLDPGAYQAAAALAAIAQVYATIYAAAVRG